MYRMFVTALFIIEKKWKQPKCLCKEEVRKYTMVHYFFRKLDGCTCTDMEKFPLCILSEERSLKQHE